MTLKLLTLAEKTLILEIAQKVVERFESNRLTRIPFDYLDEVPSIPGVYLAVKEDNQILYIGKSQNLSKRCKIPPHERLPDAIEKGAEWLCIARVSKSQAWLVEQWLINYFSPGLLNEKWEPWWLRPTVETLDEVGFDKLKAQIKDFLTPDVVFTADSPEVQGFFAFVAKYRNEYFQYYGLEITDKTTPIQAFSRFCKTQLGVSFKDRRIGGRGKQVYHYSLDINPCSQNE